MVRELSFVVLTLRRSRISSPLLIANPTEEIRTRSRAARRLIRQASIAAFILLVISTSIGQSPMIKEDLSEYGFSILLPDDPTFRSELQKLGPSVSATAELLAPGAALVKNTSQRAVVAFGVRFTKRSDDGHIATSDVIDNQPSALMDMGNPGRYDRPRGGLVSPGGTRLVTPNGVVDSTSKSYTRYQTPTPWTIVKVQIDSVVFDDGQAIGPDQLGVVEGLRAHVNAQQDLLEEISESLSHGELLHDVLQRLQSAALPRTQSALTQPGPSGIYALVRRQYLDELITTELKAGDEVALGRVQQLKYVTRPNIHGLKGGN